MLKYIFALAFLALVYAERKAIATLSNGAEAGAAGTISFTEVGNVISITGIISGLKEGSHGFHIHAVGDISGGCTSMLGHFNPYNVSHGGPDAAERHVGDLGNIVANATGYAVLNFNDTVITLTGDHNIIGRGVVVHEDADDLGLGGAPDSKTTGNAGKRVGCGVIGTLIENNGSGAERLLLTALLPGTMIGLVMLQQRFL